MRRLSLIIPYSEDAFRDLRSSGIILTAATTNSPQHPGMKELIILVKEEESEAETFLRLKYFNREIKTTEC